jgi:glycosyltransferase involved in cell wall biosynthesis
MRILLAHNYYQQSGGEDQVVAAESGLLRRKGHALFQFTRQNSDIEGMSRLRVARDTLWNPAVYREIRQTIRRERIDVVHFHNTFPLVSPAAYYAARSERVPVIQTLHNYRLLCPGSLLYREGRVCESCMDRLVPWPGVLHSCYRKSRAQTTGVAGMLTFHRMLRTWSRAVDTYIALTEFSRDKFVQGGLPGNKITVKANFLDTDPGEGERPGEVGYALYAGRLAEDKGIRVLLDAWEALPSPWPLRIAGAGPLLEYTRDRAKHLPHVEVCGGMSHDRVLELMKGASVLIVPSLWYEGLPTTVIEAYATGLPVIASDLGSLRSLIGEGVTGYRFPAGDSRALAGCVERMLAPDHDRAAMGVNARAVFQQNYSPDVSYQALLSIYQRALERKGENGHAGK